MEGSRNGGILKYSQFSQTPSANTHSLSKEIIHMCREAQAGPITTVSHHCQLNAGSSRQIISRPAWQWMALDGTLS